MSMANTTFAFEVELGPGERLALPAELVAKVGPGKWVVTVQPSDDQGSRPRRHDAFLAGFSSQDEGLYDDLAR